MIGIVRADAMEFIQQCLGDHLGSGVSHPMDHPVSHPADRIESLLSLQPVEQRIRGRFVVGGRKPAAVLLMAVRVNEREVFPAQANAVNLPVQPSLERLDGLVKRELDA